MARRLVLDASVLIAAFRSRNGASFALMQQVAIGIVRPLATVALFLEYEAVLKRPEQRRASGLSMPECDLVLAALAAATEPVRVHFLWRPQLIDPADELVLEAAVNGGADALVTHNRRHFLAAGRRFGVSVLTPAEAIGNMRP